MRVYVSICAYQTLRSSKAAVDCMEDFPLEYTIHRRPQFWCTRFVHWFVVHCWLFRGSRKSGAQVSMKDTRKRLRNAYDVIEKCLRRVQDLSILAALRLAIASLAV